MQGTIVMMMALSGLGCHHRGCDDCYATPSCYAAPYMGGCYSACYDVGYAAPSMPSCYATAYSCYDSCYSSCYGGFYDACYSSCYSGGHGHGGLFGGLKRRRCGVCNPCTPVYAGCNPCAPVTYSCYSGCYGGQVFGSYTPVYAMEQGVMPSYQGYPTTQTLMAPSKTLSVPSKQVMGSPMVPSKQTYGAPMTPSKQGYGAATAAPATETTTPAPAPPAVETEPAMPESTPPPVEDTVTPPPVPGGEPAIPTIPGDGDLNVPPPPVPGGAPTTPPGL